MRQNIPEEIYREAILQWKREHPEKKYLDIKRKETIELNGIGTIKKLLN